METKIFNNKLHYRNNEVLNKKYNYFLQVKNCSLISILTDKFYMVNYRQTEFKKENFLCKNLIRRDFSRWNGYVDK